MKNQQRLQRAEEIKKIEDATERYNALVEFIKPEHTAKCRWSVEAIADIANAYIDAKSYEKFCENNPSMRKGRYTAGYAAGQASVLERLLFVNGWGWVVGMR